MNSQNKNKKLPVRRLTVAAVFTALIAVLTSIYFPIPGGHGYIHLGDSMIYACAWAVGGSLAGIAAALGSALADILLGYPQYALVTLVIKFLMGYISYLIMKAFSYKMKTNIFAMIVASTIMVVCYTAYEYFLSGIGGATVAFGQNLIQFVGGVTVGTVFVIILDKIKPLAPYITWKVNKNNE